MLKIRGFRWVILVVMLCAMAGILRPVQAESRAPTVYFMDMFTFPLHLPEGARIDYLRLYFRDFTANADGYAWVTAYPADGTLMDVAFAMTTGDDGSYSTALSAYSGHIVDNSDYAYVLNFHPGVFGPDMRLCGMRVAYKLPDGVGGWSLFHYQFVPGSAFFPYSSRLSWTYGFFGCTYASLWEEHVPMIMK